MCGRGGGSRPCWRVWAIAARASSARSRSLKRPALSRVSATRPERTRAKSTWSLRYLLPDQPTPRVSAPVSFPLPLRATVIAERTSRLRRNSRSSASWESPSRSCSDMRSKKRGSIVLPDGASVGSGTDGARSARALSVSSPRPGPTRAATRSTSAPSIRSIVQKSATSGTITSQTSSRVSRSDLARSEASAIRLRTSKRRFTSRARRTYLASTAAIATRSTASTKMMTPSNSPPIRTFLLKKA